MGLPSEFVGFALLDFYVGGYDLVQAVLEVHAHTVELLDRVLGAVFEGLFVLDIAAVLLVQL